MNTNSIKEKLSRAYIYAITAKLNLAVNESSKDVDGCGYDFTILDKFVGEKRTACSPINDIKIQLKSVSLSSKSMIKDKGDYFQYNLDTNIPSWGPSSYLFVVVIPEEAEIDNWITLSDEEIILRKCAYFYAVPKDGLSTGSINIPKVNIVTSESFNSLFKKISKEDF